jgi:pimeloyl-ACP methyl ester carboxylesterase
MVKANDIEMYTEVHGEGEPLILIMGFGATSQDWSPGILEGFSKHFKTIIFDNRGTGKTSKGTQKNTIKQMADDIAGLLESMNIEKTHVLGISLGGMIAQEFVLSHQNRVNKLVLCSTYAGGEARVVSHDSREIVALVRDPPKDMVLEDIVKKFLRLNLTPQYIEENLERVIPMGLDYLERTKSGTRQDQWETIMEFDAYSRLDQLHVSTLIVAGEMDIWVLPENSKVMHERITDSKLILYPDTAHLLTESESQFIVDVIEFLGES